MTSTPRRWRLRAATADMHLALDTAIEHANYFSDAIGYRGYLAHMELFQRLCVHRFAADSAVALVPFIDMLTERHRCFQSDLKDLDEPARSGGDEVWLPASDAATLGALYVLEGSNLGARLLLKRAEALGFSVAHGARGLAAQAAASAEWKTFLAVLETAPLDEAGEAACLDGARAVFALAAAHLIPADAGLESAPLG